MAKQQTAAEFFDPANRTPAEQRFYALRESGYRGPIDQDGNAVDSPMPPARKPNG